MGPVFWAADENENGFVLGFQDVNGLRFCPDENANENESWYTSVLHITVH